MTYKEIKNNEEVNELLKKGDRNLGLLGYTDHSKAHVLSPIMSAADTASTAPPVDSSWLEMADTMVMRSGLLRSYCFRISLASRPPYSACGSTTP